MSYTTGLCPECMGNGEVRRQRHILGIPAGLKWVPCERCDGTGFVEKPATPRSQNHSTRIVDDRRTASDGDDSAFNAAMMSGMLGVLAGVANGSDPSRTETPAVTVTSPDAGGFSGGFDGGGDGGSD